MIRFLPLIAMGAALYIAADMIPPLFDLRRAADAQASCDSIAQSTQRAPDSNRLVLPSELSAFLVSQMLPVKDPWGTPYRVEHTADGSLQARSAGPDWVFDSTDDVLSR